MKHLIEFKLHNGQFPYFVENVIGGVDVDGKRYGISRDTETSYLPDTVRIMTEDEFVSTVKSAGIYKQSGDDEAVLMSDAEKDSFAREWIARHSDIQKKGGDN